MSRILEKIYLHASRQPESVALNWAHGKMTYAELAQAVDSFAVTLERLDTKIFASLLPNDPRWVIVDLAALKTGIIHIPLPPFFSMAQIEHALTISTASHLITDDQLIQFIDPLEKFFAGNNNTTVNIINSNATLYHFEQEQKSIPQAIRKITFTSGTTGTPRGVMLSLHQIEQVAFALADTVEHKSGDIHVCLSPLAILLENIGGLYAPLIAGISCYLATPAESGMKGAAQIDGLKLYHLLNNSSAISVIFSPAMLQAITSTGMTSPDALRFIAVGGTIVSPSLLKEADSLSLPVYQGYGLSECASVVTLNTSEHNQSGSVGRPLSHIRIKISAEGEVLIKGGEFNSYLDSKSNETFHQDGWFASGDLGYLKDDYLYITGRKKRVIITAFGRNFSPEWVEQELTLQKGIDQAAVFGDALPANTVVICATPGISEHELQESIKIANSQLPDYAQLTYLIHSDVPFSITNKMLTGTGRIRHKTIWQNYKEKILSNYEAQHVG